MADHNQNGTPPPTGVLWGVGGAAPGDSCFVCAADSDDEQFFSTAPPPAAAAAQASQVTTSSNGGFICAADSDDEQFFSTAPPPSAAAAASQASAAPAPAPGIRFYSTGPPGAASKASSASAAGSNFICAADSDDEQFFSTAPPPSAAPKASSASAAGSSFICAADSDDEQFFSTAPPSSSARASATPKASSASAAASSFICAADSDDEQFFSTAPPGAQASAAPASSFICTEDDQFFCVNGPAPAIADDDWPVNKPHDYGNDNVSMETGNFNVQVKTKPLANGQVKRTVCIDELSGRPQPKVGVDPMRISVETTKLSAEISQTFVCIDATQAGAASSDDLESGIDDGDAVVMDIPVDCLPDDE